jgi:hypothetical protein
MIEYIKTPEGIEVWQRMLMETIPLDVWEKQISDREKTIAEFDAKKYTDNIQAEIAALKAKEKLIRQRQVELLSDLAATERTVRENLLSQKDLNGKAKYILPDPKRVLRIEKNIN